MQYLMSEKVNGQRDPAKDEQVDEQFVERFTSRDTVAFFTGLGGTEEHRVNASGVIYIKATSPDGTTVREVVFTPIP